jgi:hypothetical protein
MIIQDFTAKDNIIKYHYSFTQLREFITEGRESGAVGMLLIKRNGRILTYKGYGTIDKPRRNITTIAMYSDNTFKDK